MKKILPLALLLIFTAMYSFAQKTIIRNETADIAGGTSCIIGDSGKYGT
ncbi:MAG: hypothetical protein IPP34_13855 [Bacteroidetes bacterium]|nr:hypothetical protein [Bacteroidota bacterium]